MSHFLGINIGPHDSSVALITTTDQKLTDIEILLLERFTKKKHQGLFPFGSFKELRKSRPQYLTELSDENIAVNNIGENSLSFEKKMINLIPKYSDLLELHQLQKVSTLYNSQTQFFTHHLCHVYSSLAQCPYKKAIIVVSDGMGNFKETIDDNHPEAHLKGDPRYRGMEYLSVYLMDDGKIHPLAKQFSRNHETLRNKITVNDGLGYLFETLSQLFFGDWQSAGKVMGLAAYGNAKPLTDREQFVREIGNIETAPKTNKLSFDEISSELFQKYADLAATVQTYFEEYMIDMLKNLRLSHPEYENIILVGGCALNCLLNDRILREKIYQSVFVPPFPNDEGISLGAALALASKKEDWKFSPVSLDNMSAALGSKLSDTSLMQKNVLQYFSEYEVTCPSNLIQEVASLLNAGEVIAWIQGRSEVGPRALGHRSLLVRPDRKDVKAYLNENIKFRERFRPYGATILKEEAPYFFQVESGYESPFMTFAPKVRSEKRELLKEIVHPDGTTRIQTLSRGQNTLFYDLLKEFKHQTGLPILLNTSLNIMGQPILESIEDAQIFFKQSKVKIMVYGDYLICKKASSL